MSSGPDESGNKNAATPNGSGPGSGPKVESQLTLKCANWEMAERIGQANISKGGMFLRTARPGDLGSKVLVSIELPDGESLKVVATVRHVITPEQGKKLNRPAGIGVAPEKQCRKELAALTQIAKLRQGKILGTEVEPGESGARRTPTPASTVLPKGPVAEIFGIDLGVTYSGVAVAIGEQVRMVPDEKGRTLLPTVVSYPESGTPLVGWAARPQQLVKPERTVASIKRILGRGYADQDIAGYLQYAAFATEEGPNGSVLVAMGEDRLAPPQICATVLRQLQATVTGQLETELSRAVFTVPVTFGEDQKNALRQAARIAQIEVVDIVEEPVAGALAYGFGQGKNELVAVYDFGGGTFDFTVLDMSLNHYRVLVTDGDSWLGGDDFDLALAETMANDFWQQSKVELRNRSVEWQRLLFACEKAKRKLSIEPAAEVYLRKIVEAPNPMDLRESITRDKFSEICHDLFERSIDVCEGALDSIGLSPRDVTEVVATGGTSRIPFIREGLAKFFDKEIKPLVNPEDAIALGAGLYAARRAKHAVSGVVSTP